MYNINQLYEQGKIPEHYYNQLNGKTANENYHAIRIKRQKKFQNILLSLV
jgi:hypothetical protein